MQNIKILVRDKNVEKAKFINTVLRANKEHNDDESCMYEAFILDNEFMDFNLRFFIALKFIKAKYLDTDTAMESLNIKDVEFKLRAFYILAHLESGVFTFDDALKMACKFKLINTKRY